MELLQWLGDAHDLTIIGKNVVILNLLSVSLLASPNAVDSFDDGDFDDVEEDEGLNDLENVEDVRSSSCILISSY